MRELSEMVLCYGQDTPPPERIPLRAGPLAMIYEAGDLRYIRLGDVEIVRRLYVAVRDHNWGTVLPRLSKIQMDVQPQAFQVRYQAEHRQGDIHFSWEGTITGSADGTLTFRMDGRAHSTFQRNRIGFCVLHPMACAGLPCVVEHTNGRVTEGVFPREIAPHQPFRDMRAIRHPVLPGLQAEIRFEGDIFEMEDQRNWMDASYKSYCTPLDLPFPVLVEAGTVIQQRVTLRLVGSLPGAALAEPPGGAPVRFTVDSTTAQALPRIGLGVAGHGEPLSPDEIRRLKALHLAHLRVDLDLDLEDAPLAARLRRAAEDARALGVRLEVALQLGNQPENRLRWLRTLLETVKPPVYTWLIFHHDDQSERAQWVRLAQKHLAGYDAAARFGGGTPAFFTQLNRNRPAAPLDALVYSLNPQVHAFDSASLVETLPTQAATLESARRFSGDALLMVGPITFKMRFNPAATGAESSPAPGELPPQVDVRQMSLFGAGWTAGSLKYLAEGGAHSLTYYETTGWLGVMERAAGSPLPEQFRSIPSAVFPLYHVLADVGEFAGGSVLAGRSSDPLRVEGLALRRDGALRLILANFSPEMQYVRLEGLSGRFALRMLDATNAEAAMRDPERYRAAPGERIETAGSVLELALKPCAVATIDRVAG